MGNLQLSPNTAPSGLTGIKFPNIFTLFYGSPASDLKRTPCICELQPLEHRVLWYADCTNRCRSFRGICFTDKGDGPVKNAPSDSIGELGPVLGGPQGFPVNMKWLRGGLTTFIWFSNRSIASLHQRAATALTHLRQASKRATDEMQFQLFRLFRPIPLREAGDAASVAFPSAGRESRH